MYYFSETHIIFLRIIISNVIIVYTTNELSQNIENQTTITIEKLDKLFKEYPAFIKLTLLKQDYYTGKNFSRCPMPYNENTILDDPDVVASKLFNPRECKKPWTWTQKNEIDVCVPIDGTIGKRLGQIIQPSLKNNSDIIQSYTHYLNVIESVGLTLIDRFCLFEIEVMNRFDVLECTEDYEHKYSLFNIKINIEILVLIAEDFKQLLKKISFAFEQYYISTLPIDCMKNIIEKMIMYCNGVVFEDNELKESFKNCRELIKSKISYAALENDRNWQWDIISDCKPDDNLMIVSLYKNNKMGLNLFAYNKLQ